MRRKRYALKRIGESNYELRITWVEGWKQRSRFAGSRESGRSTAIDCLFPAFRLSGFLAFWLFGVCATIVWGQNTRSFYNDPFGGEYFVEASVDKSTAYVNEQVTYILSYYYTTISPALESPKYKLPDFVGFRKKKLPHPEPYWKNIRGARYRVEERKIALFPISSGTINIKPARVDIPRASYLDETRMLTSESIELKILPLSEIGKPVGFQGAVGNYTLTARVDKDTVELGQPITLTVSIVGSGNINALPEPEIIELTAFTRYGPKMSANPTTETDQIQGEKLYEYVFVPTNAGQWQIPSIQMPYFDPNREIYHIARAEPIDIRVIPGATTVNVEASVLTNVQILGQDIRHIKSADANLRDQSRYLYQRSYFWALQLLPLCAIAAAILYKRWQQRQQRVRPDIIGINCAVPSIGVRPLEACPENPPNFAVSVKPSRTSVPRVRDVHAQRKQTIKGKGAKGLKGKRAKG